MLNLIVPLMWLGCDGEPTPQVALPPMPVAETILLARHPEKIVSVEVAPRCREGDVPASFPTPSGWLPGDITDGSAVYTSTNPTLARLSPSLPEGFAVVDPSGQPLRFVRDGSGGPNTWGVLGDRIQVTVPSGTNPSGYQIRYPDATDRLRRFNFQDAGMEIKDFIHRTERFRGVRHHGVFLPAPAEITWAVRVPEDGRLLADVAILRSSWRAEHVSDGATLYAEVIDKDGVTEVGQLSVGPAQWVDLVADLSAWEGQDVELRFRVDPGESNLEDYLMVGEPTLYTPKENPRRIILFFADTLRADHMGVYGYERETSPNLDRWAGGGTVFEEVRSVAPWTYPSARSVLSGRLPDAWDDGPILPELLAEHGWSTLAFANNAYMSRFFGMDRGWSWHFYEAGQDGRGQARALANALKKNTDRDTVYLVQLMDVHLPYAEPEPYRSLFTDAALEDLPDPIVRSDVLSYTGDASVAKQYLIDRYDQSLRYLDRSIAPIFERVDDNDTIIFFSDHGEEFWEHGGFEHGHTLYEELLRVPLIIVGPDAPAGRVSAPASLLDLTPTVLDIAGIPVPEGATVGTSLLPAARQEPAALAALEERPTGFGWVLYEEDGWGVVSGDEKWITQGSRARRYDLSSDPGEQSPQATETAAALSPWQDRASAALGRPVVEAWRLVQPEPFGDRAPEIRLSAPSGIASAWTGLESPNIPKAEVRVEGSVVVVSAAAGGVMPREVFVTLASSSEPLTITVRGESSEFVEPDAVASEALGAVSGVAVWRATVAEPGESLQTTASSVESQLRALGYLE